MYHDKGFTLIELLVVIAILAVLAVVVVLTLNPAGLLQESRDANRLSDMATLNNAIGYSLADNSSESLGSADTVYMSVPDPTATSTAGDQCQGLGLPVLPAAYSWHCAASSTFRSTNGNGWIPVNLSADTFGAPLSQLPVDPVNQTSSRLWYTFTTDGNGKFEATAVFESAKYKLGGSGDQVSADGGTLATVYEKGSKLGLEPLDYGDASLVGYWTFDEGSGGTAYDYSGNNATGTLTNSPTWTTGKVNGSLSFVTSSVTYVDMGNPASLQLSGNMTIAAWVNTTSTTGQNGIVTKSYNATGTSRSYRIGINASGVPVLEVSDISGSFRDADASAAITLGSWQYVAVSYSAAAGSATWYINGVPEGTVTGLYTSIQNVTQHFQVGMWDTGTGANGFSGQIDDVRIYNRTLAASEIAAMYNGGK